MSKVFYYLSINEHLLVRQQAYHWYIGFQFYLRYFLFSHETPPYIYKILFYFTQNSPSRSEYTKFNKYLKYETTLNNLQILLTYKYLLLERNFLIDYMKHSSQNHYLNSVKSNQLFTLFHLCGKTYKRRVSDIIDF